MASGSRLSTATPMALDLTVGGSFLLIHRFESDRYLIVNHTIMESPQTLACLTSLLDWPRFVGPGMTGGLLSEMLFIRTALPSDRRLPGSLFFLSSFLLRFLDLPVDFQVRPCKSSVTGPDHLPLWSYRSRCPISTLCQGPCGHLFLHPKQHYVHHGRQSGALQGGSRWHRRRLVARGPQHLLQCKSPWESVQSMTKITNLSQSGDIAWVIVSTALVLLMIPGVGYGFTSTLSPYPNH